MLFLYLFLSHIIEIQDLVYIRMIFLYLIFKSHFYISLLKYEISFTTEYDIFISHFYLILISHIIKLRDLVYIRI